MGDPEMRPPLPAQASGGDRCPEMLLGERCHHAHGHDGWHRFTHSVPAPSSSSPSPDGDEMFGEPTAEEDRMREVRWHLEILYQLLAGDLVPRALRGTLTSALGDGRYLLSRLRAAEERERQLMQRIDDLEEGTWPFEWTVATAERERRKKAEDALRAAEQGRAEVEQTITSLTGKWRVAVRDLASARARIAQAAALLDDSHDGRDPFCRVCKALAALTSSPPSLPSASQDQTPERGA